MRNMTARAAAAAAGLKTYETGTPCKQGHVAPRSTRTGTCTECTKVASKRWLESRPGKAAEYTAAYRARNPDKVLAQDRAYKALLRERLGEHVRKIKRKSYRKVTLEREGRVVADSPLLPEPVLVQRMSAAHGGQLLFVGGYAGMLTNAQFTCATHGGNLTAHPHNVLRGANPCPQCNHMRSSGEDAVFRFLSNLTAAEQRNRTLLKPKELDIYLPEIKLAVEYCGEFWHSHGDAEDERKNKRKHHQKYLDCKTQGIRLITLYETEWKEHNYAVRRLLRNAVGKSRGKLMARKCELRKATTHEARAFYERYHPQGGSGHGEHYALFWQGKMVACMRFVLGANDRGAGAANRVWTLGRYATRVTVAGAASRLFKAFVQEYNPPVVKSFSDNRFFEGGMYEQLGFVLEAEVEPDYQVWHPKLGTKPKPHYQRRAIPRRIAEIGANEVFDPETDQRTEAQITYALGARRLYDCGKKRWVWTPTP